MVMSRAKKPRSTHLQVGAVSLTVLALLINAGPALGDASQNERPLTINFEANTVADGSGAALRESQPVGDNAESTTTATTAEGSTALIIRQSAPVDTAPVEIYEPVEPEVLLAARQFSTSVPAELVGTKFMNEGVTEKAEGVIRTESLANSVFKLQFMQAVTPQTVSFAWSAREGVQSTQVIRDGVIVKKNASGSFSDSGLRPGKLYEYQIVSTDSEGEVLGTRMVPISLPNSESTSQVRKVDSRTYQPWTSAMAYRTFIPDSQVDMDYMTTMGCGQAGQSGMTFSGDDRGWATPPFNIPWDSASTFRTSAFVNINWDNAAPYDVIWVKEVRPTGLYQNGVLKEQRTASSDGIQFENVSASTNYAQVQILHSVGNPFCVTGAITYNAWARFYRSGTFEVSGTRFPAPNHEVYGGWDTPSGERAWHPLARLENEGFACLTGVCGSTQVYGSATH